MGNIFDIDDFFTNENDTNESNTNYKMNKINEYNYFNGNCQYNIKTRKLYLYDGTVSDQIIEMTGDGIKCKYIDKSGKIYNMYCPTYFR